MSSRPVTAALETALAAERIEPLLLVEALFDSGAVRMWNGDGPLAALGQNWLGAGLLLKIGQVEETSEIRAAGTQIALSGIPPAQIAIALAEDYQGRPAAIYLGAFDVATGLIVVDPLLVFRGKIDVMPIVLGRKSADIVASVESALIRLEQASRRRYTAADQRFDHPTDAGLDHVAAIQDVQIVWGQKSPMESKDGAGDAG